jgi:hypothetical protein
MKPTMYLRVLERKEFAPYDPPVTPNQSMPPIEDKTVRVVQQFWEHPNGGEVAGDMFTLIIGSWIDLPVLKA